MSDPPDPLDTAWHELSANWDAEERHRSFVALAAALDRLPEAASRYRALRDDPERGAGARRGLEKVLGAAMARLSAERREAPPARSNYLLALTALGCLWIGTLVIARILNRPDLLHPWVFALELAAVLLTPWRRLGGGPA
ncbi:MAG: hypothetical protein U0325_02750 [Polyangiales bacterium]